MRTGIPAPLFKRRGFSWARGCGSWSQCKGILEAARTASDDSFHTEELVG
jgi:hypothetical protein